MTAAATDAFAAVRHPHVRALALARMSGVIGTQIINVAVGWQLYERTGSALSLGLVGLFELAPVLFLMIPAGNAADRFARRNIAMAAQSVMFLAAVGLMTVSWLKGPVELIYAMLMLVGAARAFSAPAVGTILPQLLKPDQFVNANAWLASAFQFASISGPAIGGLIIGFTGGATGAYSVAALGHLIFIVALSTLPAITPAKDHDRAREKRKFSDVFAGFGFVRRTPIFLAAITLDMFAVLLGGAVALLPIFAKDILQVGPEGLGWLRAAPAMGSLSMLLVVTRLKPMARPGFVLLGVVVGFGLATIGFGLSTNFFLSLFCLFLTGLFDSVSVIVRLTLEQVVTPDRLRGRVSAINYLFIGFSNEFGAFESGATAWMFGPIASVVGGGIGTIAVVIMVAVLWPALARIGPLHSLRPREETEAGRTR
ncbi:MAG: MFS transporter [Rhodospirillaceae bacterium]|nr:MFS transporter [Rhodospirillaceae bacterium]